MPTTPSSRRNSHRNRRGSTPPTPGQNGSKLAGRIMWLPHADELSSSTGFADECHNHPVLVLSKRMSADGKVDILMMTSFGGQVLEAKHRYSRVQLRETFLPIDPSPPHPDNNIQLKLNHGVTLRKNSYVKTEEQRKILFSLLRNYERHNNKVYALTNASYHIVVEHCGYREAVHSPPVTVTPPRPPVARPQPQPDRVPSYGHGTIPTSQPYPASRPVQTWQSNYDGYYEDRSSSFWNPDGNSQRKRRPTSPFRHVPGGSGSSDDLPPSARAVLGLVGLLFLAACGWGAVGLYKLFKHLLGGLKEVDWHKVAKSVEYFLWDVVVNMAKVVKYMVVTAAKCVAWVAKSAWGLVRDMIMGAPKEKPF